ncbi:SDR family NAD(P)-dependent oxidoreductase [Membranihabitans marinus]|uniref:SDR family NAD(P)-dependent oxidoreductase n=1 Tax=Membranihabitans marinus TaxID=1227546 RepID=UPI001F2188E8|nr:SDR family oxidoreductase [Membranihabitans marinus]
MPNIDLFNLKDQVAVITGGASGLGYDMACELANAGCHLVITSRFKEKLVEPAQNLRNQYGIDVLTLQLDQCFHEEVKNMAAQAQQWKGHIDILINNAGGGSGASEGDLFKRAPNDMVNMIHTNLIGPLFCSQEIGKIMAGQQSGKIINIGSIAGMVGRDRSMYRDNQKSEQPIDYAAAKAGIIGMTRDLAAYMAPYGICVNCISPGGFQGASLPQEFVNAYNRATALGRMGKMGQDIKGVALFLASQASDYVTGQNIVVDGGFSIWK